MDGSVTNLADVTSQEVECVCLTRVGPIPASSELDAEAEDEQEEEAPPVMLGALSVTTATIFTLSSFSSSVRAVVIFWQR